MRLRALLRAATLAVLISWLPIPPTPSLARSLSLFCIHASLAHSLRARSSVEVAGGIIIQMRLRSLPRGPSLLILIPDCLGIKSGGK